jgi:hypothetical protein
MMPVVLLLFLAFSLPARAQTDATDPSGASAAAPSDPNQALRDLLAQKNAAPWNTESERKIEDIASTALPNPIDPTLLPSLPVDAAAAPYRLGTVVTLQDFLPSKAVEPQNGWTFSRVTYVYEPAGPDGMQPLFCRVHYDSLDRRSFAIRVGQLLLLAHDTLVTRTHTAPENGDEPFDVWLCTGGQSGGEQFQSNIYFYDLDVQRSSIEWIREIVHEYGHLALPAIGGYSSPEYWANGYVGERLMVRWMARRANGPAMVEAVWGDFSGYVNFDRLLLKPAIALYTRVGVNPDWASRTDEAGMRYLIGELLTIDDTYGSRMIGSIFDRLPRQHEARSSDVSAGLVALAPPKPTERRRGSL